MTPFIDLLKIAIFCIKMQRAIEWINVRNAWNGYLI